jgi:hypothetical protein
LTIRAASGDLSRMRKLAALSLALTATAACESSDGGTPPPEQKGPEVTGSQSDSSPPLRDIPPAKRQDEKRVHPVKPLPRPHPDAPDGGSNDKAP